MTPASGGGGPPRGSTFPRDLLAGGTLDAARALLGAWLVREPEPAPERATDNPAAAGSARIGRIVEVEAYIGPDDRASHARMGPTPRNRAMFGPPGLAYVYLVYGMHHCLNVVTEPAGRPAAVLIRAVEPVLGPDAMRLDRLASGRSRRVVPDHRLAAGPGLVGAAFSIDRSFNGVDLCDPASSLRLLLPPPAAGPLPAIEATARIGVAFAGEPWTSVPWRFVLAGNPSLSRATATSQGTARSQGTATARVTATGPAKPTGPATLGRVTGDA
jgi:DNA-3-methyladenine glycosylase